MNTAGYAPALGPPFGTVAPGSPARRTLPRLCWLPWLLAACWAPAALAAPPLPYGLSATAADSAAMLRWEQSRATSIVSWEYRHQRDSQATWTDWTTIPGSDASTYTYTVPGLTNGATYVIQLRARDAVGAGRWASVTVSLPEAPNNAVTIPDPALRAAIAAAVDKTAEDQLTQGDLAMLSTFAVVGARIGDLTGLGEAINLTSLDLTDNGISALTPLAELRRLTSLTLDRNLVSDLTPLAGLTQLETLRVPANDVQELGPLRSLSGLKTLVLSRNRLSDLAPLAALTSLEELDLGGNDIVNVYPLRGLRELRLLDLSSNQVEDVAPLLDNTGLGDGDTVDLRANPLGDFAKRTQVPALRQRGVNVRFLPRPPRDLMVTPGRGQATLTWTVGPVTVQHYEVRHGPGSPPRFGEWTRIEGSGRNTREHTLTGLPAGGTYTIELRAVGLGGAGEAATVATGAIEAPNAAPRVLNQIADVVLEPGDLFDRELTEYFADADDRTLRYQARTSDPRYVFASVIGASLLRISGLQPGAATVTVTARDPLGASASIEVSVSVGTAVRVLDAVAAEGEEAEISVLLTRPRETPTVLPYTIGADADPATADAGAEDHEGVAGTVTIPAGATGESLMIAIVDDDLIEPARETFVVTFRPPAADVGYVLVDESATVTIEEGVCDRTPVVRDALRGREECTVPTPASLAAEHTLTLDDQGIESLQGGDFQGLAGLTLLDLGDNALRALPAGLLTDLGTLDTLRLENNRLTTLSAEALAGASALGTLVLSNNRLSYLPRGVFRGQPQLSVLRLEGNLLAALPEDAFVGLVNLTELALTGNPGAPFVLAMRLAREDGALAAPGPATVYAAIAGGAPFAMQADATWANAEPVSVTIAPGAAEGARFMVPAARGSVQLMLAAPALPVTRCGDLQLPCFRGLATSGSTLSLYRPPPSVLRPAPRIELVGEDEYALQGALFFAAADGSALAFSAVSSNPALATATVLDGRILIATTADGGAGEGGAEITVTATDDAGQTASLTFTVVVAPGARGFLRGWRQGLPAVPQSQEAEASP